MISNRHLPNPERISMILASVLLVLAMTQFINLPAQLYSISFLGIFLPIEIKFRTIVAIFVAGMTATGTDWLLRDHPNLESKSTIPHWFLPALTAWISHIVLSNLPISANWWLVFLGTGIFLLIVLYGEYIILDQSDPRYSYAYTGLNILAYAQFILLAISLKTIGLRLFLILPALGISAGFICLRAFQTGIMVKQPFRLALVGMVITIQLSAALHYLPINPISYGLILLGPLYVLIYGGPIIFQSPPTLKGWIEPIIILFILWITAFILL